MNTNFKFYLLTCAICILLFITILAPYIVPFDPYEQNLANTLQAPNTIHLLGTDKYGRDIFSRILIGAQTTIFSSLFLVIISSVFGSLIGVICGYFGKNLDNLLMRITDIFLAFPGIIFAIALVGILGGSIFNAILALSLISWPKFALLARSQTLVLKNSLFIKASIINGSSDSKIIYKHFYLIYYPFYHYGHFEYRYYDYGNCWSIFLGLGFQPLHQQNGYKDEQWSYFFTNCSMDDFVCFLFFSQYYYLIYLLMYLMIN